MLHTNVPFSLRNPLPEQLVDSSELRNLFKKYAIVPYYGNYEDSSHSMLQLVDQLAKLSPSYSACQADIKTLSFGSSLSVVPAIDGMVNHDDDPLKSVKPLDEKTTNEFWALMKSLGLFKSSFVDLAKSIYKHADDSGNAYIRITVSKVGDQTAVKFKALHYRKTAYLFTKAFENKQVVYTQVWDENYWRQVAKPELLPVSFMDSSFNWKETGSGSIKTYETVLHLRALDGMSEFYGSSTTESLLYWMYVEHINADLSCKVAATDFVSKKIIAFEEEDAARRTRTEKPSSKVAGDLNQPNQQINSAEQTPLQKRMTALRGITTSEGDKPSVLAGISYPFGTKAPIMLSLEINRDWEYDSNLVTKASSHIYQAHKWYRELTGFVQQRAGIGSNMIRDLLIVAGHKAIRPQQIEKTDIFARMLNEISSITGITISTSVMFPNLVNELVQQINIANGKGTAITDITGGAPADTNAPKAEAANV